jgi:hypothetical protein
MTYLYFGLIAHSLTPAGRSIGIEAVANLVQATINHVRGVTHIILAFLLA